MAAIDLGTGPGTGDNLPQALIKLQDRADETAIVLAAMSTAVTALTTAITTQGSRLTALENATGPAPIITPMPASTSGVIVAVGDSIAAGYRPDQSGQPSVAAFGWPQRMGFANSVTIDNTLPYARTGSALTETQADFGNDLSPLYDASKTCVAIIERGINDIRGYGSSGGNITTMYNALSARVAQFKAQGFYIAVTTLLPFSDGGTGGANVAPYNVKVRANAAGADMVIDLAGNPVMGAAGASDDTTLYVDKLHPTDEGMRRLGAAASAQVDMLLAMAPRAVATTPPPADGAYVGGNLAVTNGTYAASATGFGQKLNGGFAELAAPAGIPASDTWSVELFATFVGSTGSVIVVMSQDVRFSISIDGGGRLQVSVADNTGAGQFFTGGSYQGGGSLPVVNNTGPRHIRLSCKPGTQTLEMDGQNLASLSVAQPNTDSGQTPLRIRAHGSVNVTPGDFGFNGSIDEVAIFNTYRAGVTVPTAPYVKTLAGMVQLWHLDGNGLAA